MKTPKIINAISFVEDDLISAANDQKAKPISFFSFFIYKYFLFTISSCSDKIEAEKFSKK